MKLEVRTYQYDEPCLRAHMENDKMILEGTAARYNTESRLLYENGKKFVERILPGAFKDVINNDVVFTYNHSKDSVMARTINNTLTLSEDENGLHYRAELNNTTESKDLYERVSRGDIVENSFAFNVDEGQKWSRTSEGVPLRSISRISNLFDVSPVTRAAYPNTEVFARGFEEFEANESPIKIDNSRELKELELLNLKLKIK